MPCGFSMARSPLDSAGSRIARATRCPEGSEKVRWRSRLRYASEAGLAAGDGFGTTDPGRWNSAVERVVSIFLLRRDWPSPRSKKVGQSMKRRGARLPPERSSGSAGSEGVGVKTKAKKGPPPAPPVKF